MRNIYREKEIERNRKRERERERLTVIPCLECEDNVIFLNKI